LSNRLNLSNKGIDCSKIFGYIFARNYQKLNGLWQPTAEPQLENYTSYHLNTLICPPGFVTWVDLAKEWNEACKPGEPVKKAMLQTFMNIRLGLTFEEQGESPKVMELMKNTREYPIGIVPDVTADEDQNGKIIMLTLACDINGQMETTEGGFRNEDVRLDWEVLAHSAAGATYSIEHGSIGTFKRKREKSKVELANDFQREKWTLTHNVENSVWPELEKVMRRKWKTESGNELSVLISLIDTGFGEKQAMQFIQSFDDIKVFGVKGRTEKNYRPLQRDTSPIARSSEKPKHLYIVEVNQMKDDLAEFMKLRRGEDETQPQGFMNFPQPDNGKYLAKSYFMDYEGETRIPELDSSGETIGYKWEKKTSGARNHFWDVRVYNLAAPLIYVDLLKRSNPKYKHLTYEDFVALVTR